MLRGLLRFLAAGLLVFALWTPPLQAQKDVRDYDPDAKEEHSASALPHVVFFLFTILIMSIICMPSRRA